MGGSTMLWYPSLAGVGAKALLTRYFFTVLAPVIAAGEEGIKIKKIKNKNWARKIFKKYA